MELYHTTYQEIEKITANGKFGSFLFFSSSDCHYGDITYKINIDEDRIIPARRLFEQDNCVNIIADIIKDVKELCNCDDDDAIAYLSEEKNYPVNGDASAEISWEIQKLIAQSGKLLGFAGVLLTDEHGGSYLVDMLDKEILLERI